jgi:sulfopropanediol 3-dehydrogenase
MKKYIKKAVPPAEEDLSEVRRAVSEIIQAVKTEGEAAVRRYSQKFDSWNPESFRISGDEVARAEKDLPETFKQDVRFCQDQVRNFARLQLESMHEFERETLPGVFLGQKHIPVGSVGAYVPAGRYPLISSAHMSIVTAKVAGVGRAIACTTPVGGKGADVSVLFAISAAGADEIYCIGGVCALAAMVYGVAGLPAVDMLVGPGRAETIEAKRQLFGEVGIDLLAGPSEVLIIADEFADEEIVAADLLAQCEHAPDAKAVLVSLCASLPNRVLEEIEVQLERLPTAQVARDSWERNGEVVFVDSREEAVALADEYAPEHIEVQTTEPEWFLERLRNYGSVFLGEPAAVAYGDMGIGTNHTLPTQRAARFSGGLSVGCFLKTVTYQTLTDKASAEVAPVFARQAKEEGLPGHELAALMRKRKYSDRKK